MYMQISVLSGEESQHILLQYTLVLRAACGCRYCCPNVGDADSQPCCLVINQLPVLQGNTRCCPTSFPTHNRVPSNRPCRPLTPNAAVAHAPATATHKRNQ